MIGHQIDLHNSEPYSPKIGDSFYDPMDFSLNMYDGTQWNKVTYHSDLTQILREDRKQRRIERISNIIKDYSFE